MEIYLIRHTTPAVEQGTCYGQSDIDVTETFLNEALKIRPYLPSSIRQVVSSPLRRCGKLAAYIFPSREIQWQDRLKEIDCGQWEMKKWKDIPEEVSGKWMKDFIHTPFPLGENYVQLQQRVLTVFSDIQQTGKDSAIITHGGVIRSILAHITQTPLEDSFDRFSLHYGCVIRLIKKGAGFEWQLLHNITPVRREIHRPY
jgi:alpha-ribazole phosphatase